MSRVIVNRKPQGLHRSYWELFGRFPLRPIRDEADHDVAAAVLDSLVMREEAALDEGERDYLDTLTLLIEAYDDEHCPIDEGSLSPVEALKYLMGQNDMTVSDLGKIIGSKGVASQILQGTRQLSKAHIVKLAERFCVEAGVFLGKSPGPKANPPGRAAACSDS